ncbi:hypothetical protein B0H17DRAFT_1087861 [Mycena rosella]|uniref:NADAR domain-containing protein n=1 Tax=Mycena rosella TaxID=1033263 RepID=A0AAD7CXQ7_MYCRO|nr:hypothetical protein B0H17DRAFT_1087861 [Mycena rosella]
MPQLTLAQAFALKGPKKPTSPKAERKAGPSGSRKEPKTSDSQSKPSGSAPKILFGPNGPHADFNQFSPHPVTYNGEVYPTSQHLFQAFKFHGHRDDLAERIRMASTAEMASNIAHNNKASARPDWFSINVSKMEEALFLKFSQYPLLQQELLSTGSAELYQDSLTDTFWGVGSDLLGCNELGQALERVRQKVGGSKAPARKVLQCQNCRKKPRFGQTLYCGGSCLRADISTIPPLCPQCRRRPQVGKLKYCGDTCRKAAQA